MKTSLVHQLVLSSLLALVSLSLSSCLVSRDKDNESCPCSEGFFCIEDRCRPEASPCDPGKVYVSDFRDYRPTCYVDCTSDAAACTGRQVCTSTDNTVGTRICILEDPDASCEDGIKNQGEDAIDCGGPCASCEVATCSDNARNGDETGVDCGGSCPPCDPNASCSDGVKNQGEDEADCGGPCEACAPLPTCDDSIKNQGEQQVDCGGPCEPCAAAPTCMDGIRNQDEDEIDCGGSCAPCDTCEQGSLGCECKVPNTCNAGLVCEQNMCREAKTCAQLACGKQICQEAGTNQDATCLPECVENWLWDPQLQVCVEVMVEVLAGSFQMGSASGRANEDPVHDVYVSGFFVDKYEVTVSDYQQCINASVCSTPKHTSDDEKYNYGASGREKHPVNGVDWHQASAYCAWSGKRLPTEAEWEKAARGTDGRIYPWGTDGPSCLFAVMDDGGPGCGERRTWEVGSKPGGESPYGAHDMAGNVWEWTADRYASDYYGSSPMQNPQGPTEGSERVLRGGGWQDAGSAMRVAIRSSYAPSDAYNFLGFRCVRSIP